MHPNFDFESIPKLELHVHLDGSFDTLTLYEASKVCDKEKLSPKMRECGSYEEFKKLIVHPEGQPSLDYMLKCFARFTPIVKDDLNLLKTLAWKFCENQKKHNVIYTEVRYSPHLLGPAREVVTVCTEVFARADAQLGIRVNQILCCINSLPDNAMETVELAKEFSHGTDSRVVGVDIAAGEEYLDDPESVKKFKAAMDAAKSSNLPATVHAAEASNTNGKGENVLFAQQEFHARRIGHGYLFVMQESTKDLPIPPLHFEVCLTSSLLTGGVPMDMKEHPALTLFKRGASVGLNSDDPSVFDSHISNEYKIAMEKGFSIDDLYTMSKHQVEAAFDPSAKNLLPVLEEFYAPLITSW